MSESSSRLFVDGNEAATSVAYRCSEVIAIYPITPASPMGEMADEWAAGGLPNLWGDVPQVLMMQSEGGAAGAIHGALQSGTLATTFTASQGLLLMIPNLYVIAGELTPFVLHVSARTIATHALSIFGDQSDVMACRQTGMAMLASTSVQEAHDMALVAHSATLRARVPFIHFFDGFRTSHELAIIERLSDDVIHAMIDEKEISAHRERALSPDHPKVRGTNQNPDIFFQMREACQPFYDACPSVVQDAMDRFAKLTGRAYRLYEYHGHPEAERVIVIMGSGLETVRETAKFLVAKGEKVGVVNVRLYRPFAIDDFVTTLPETVKTIAVLDRTKEPGAIGEPLYLDVVAALAEERVTGARRFKTEPVVIGGRYGLSSREFTPGMVKTVFDEMARPNPKRRFTVGIIDDVSHSSLPLPEPLDIQPAGTIQAVFFGLGSDGTVGANKNSAKIVEHETGLNAQAYFVYDSKKAGAVTVSHLRFSPAPIHSPYLVGKDSANFVACHHFPLMWKMDVAGYAAPGATLLFNAAGKPEDVWNQLPVEVQQTIIDKKLKVYTVDATHLAHDGGLGRRINTVMQTCFFRLFDGIKFDVAIGRIKEAIEHSYGRRSVEAVKRNCDVVDASVANLHEIKVPAKPTSGHGAPAMAPDNAPDFVKQVAVAISGGYGDLLPVSAFPVDGTFNTNLVKFEKRRIASDLPVWDPALCIQCNKCAMVCPHAAVRVSACPADALAGAPEHFQSLDYKGDEFGPGMKYLLAVSSDDCTGCTLCVEVCPGKDKANPRRKSLEMKPVEEVRAKYGQALFDFFLSTPKLDRAKVPQNVKQVQLLEPLFEYSGACLGCGETPYIKLVTQLFGDRTIIANATGCSSIYGGGLPLPPYSQDANGRGPAWSNSLFEDNAEFGLGMRASVDQLNIQAKALVTSMASGIGGVLVEALLKPVSGEAEIAAQRARVDELKRILKGIDSTEARRLLDVADYLVPKSVWIFGGDGWAYDIGYGGLDHVMATNRNVNILVMDTEVYSNTGGQVSKATPIGASAKFAIAGQPAAKKDLGAIAMTYGHVYVAQIGFASKDAQTVRAIIDAESYDGPSLVIAYSHCIAHGYDMTKALDQHKMAVDSGHWPLYRYDPRRLYAGEKPLVV
ncbi:MAG: pyruvate:ferredoxin (flavodoxin) oxidoreductase, partial [Alphaproteobacteria bacterium]|nr:pyruvate:ferredoxin (flavodoxin) oxidoreductase [Alphaproteobacteria bacterium]